ncbi:MAG: nucleotidyltransferase domain-containing protein [Anaerolineales bacterium]
MYNDIGLSMKKSHYDRLLKILKQELSLIYTAKLQGVYLFGSYARQEQDQESDLNILIVLSDIDNYILEIKRTSELTSRLSLDFGITISWTFVREADWKICDSPLLRNVRQESIPI